MPDCDEERVMALNDANAPEGTVWNYPLLKALGARVFLGEQDQMPDFDEERFLADINMPTDEQVERAARLLCLAQKGNMDEWPFHKDDAKAALILHLNRAKWQIGLFT